MKIIFTGSAYYKINNLQTGNSDFTLNDGFRWIKAKKAFAAKSKFFLCPKNVQILNKEEIDNLTNG